MLTSIEKKLTNGSIDIGNGILYQINENGIQLFQNGKMVDSIAAEDCKNTDKFYIEYADDIEAHFTNENGGLPPVTGISITGEFNGDEFKKEEDKKKLNDKVLSNHVLKSSNQFKDMLDKEIDKLNSNGTKEENALGGMLPQAGLNGEPVVGDGVDSSYIDKVEKEIKTTSKETEENGESMVELFGDLGILTKESVMNYIENVDSKYDEAVEESVQDIVLNMKTKVDIKRHIRKLIITNAIMKCKLAAMTRLKANNAKIIELKRNIVKVQKELNSLQKNTSAAEKAEIKRIQKEAEKEVAKEARKKKKEENKEVSEAAKPIDAVDTGKETVKEEPKKKKKDAVKERLADNGKVVPKTCDKCGAKVGLYIKGEPVWLCSNKKCGKYFGTLPFTENVSTLDEYEFQKERAILMYECTGDIKYENMITGYTNKINNYVENTNNDVAKAANSGEVFTESVDEMFSEAMVAHEGKKRYLEKTMAMREEINASIKIAKDKNAPLKKRIESLNTAEKLLKVCCDEVAMIPDDDIEDYIRSINWVLDIGRVFLKSIITSVITSALGFAVFRIPPKTQQKTACINELKKMQKKIANIRQILNELSGETVTESVDYILTEARDMEDEIRPIVDSLENKGYMVKYASPGHKKLRKKEDKEPDGVYYSHLYSDARVMFDKKYDFDGCPKGWTWRDVDGCSYLDIIPKKYDSGNETPDEAFAKWKKDYMASLKDFVSNLGSNKSDDEKEKETKESTDFYSDLMDTLFEKVEENEDM